MCKNCEKDVEMMPNVSAGSVISPGDFPGQSIELGSTKQLPIEGCLQIDELHSQLCCCHTNCYHDLSWVFEDHAIESAQGNGLCLHKTFGLK